MNPDAVALRLNARPGGQAASRHIVIHPGQAVEKEILKIVHFIRIGIILPVVVRPYILPENGPALIIPFFCIADMPHERINHGMDISVRECGLPEFLPARFRQVPEITVLHQPFPPVHHTGIAAGNGSIQPPGSTQTLRPVIHIAVTQVKIPGRTGKQFTAVTILMFVKVGTELILVYLFRDFVQQHEIDKGGQVQVLQVTFRPAQEVVPCKRRFGSGHKIADVCALGLNDLVVFRIEILECNRDRLRIGWIYGRDPAIHARDIIRIQFIHPQDITSGDIIPGDFIRIEGGDIHPVRIAFDPFHQYIHTLVIIIDNNLAEARPGNIPFHPAGHGKSDHIAQHRLVGIGCIQHPVIFRRHSQQGYIQVVA